MADNLFDTIKGIVLGTIACAVISLLMGSCKTRQSVISERVVYDTIWTTKVVHDSTNGVRVEKESIRIVPHIIRLKDTTIVYSDTTIIRNVDGNTIVYKEYLQDKGHISKDSARIEKKTIPPKEKKDKEGSKWRVFWTGIIIGILIALLIKYRKKIASFIINMVRR